MSRKGSKVKRNVVADPKYGDRLISKFVNKLMLCGKKSLAERTIYQALDEIQEKSGQEPLKFFKQALENIKPVVEVRSRRVGGATYQVPMEVRPDRRVALALRWLVGYARDRSENTMSKRLAAELMDAYNNRGSSVKKRDDVHKMAEANKAFSHYRW